MVEFENVPELVDPVLVAAFEGWNDAGEAASGVIRHLESAWDASPVAELDPEDYYDFQVTRPTVELDEDGVRSITWPTTRISWARPPGSSRDVVLIRGIEPNMRWRSFCRELLEAVERLGVRTAVLLGALLADSPHTRPVPVSGSVSGPPVVGTLRLEPGGRYELSRYEGPTGILGVLQDACDKAHIGTVALWASVPHYVSHPPSPKATLALLRRVEDLLDLTVALGELPEEARAWEHGVNELAEQDTEVAEYVKALEEQKDAAELPEASGDAIAREFERYLKGRDSG
ncbi:Predicted ATP-dependent carboligase, ATP-grasp superfamily [Thermomonospora echinospora]|uniref:Predicted ATP-dependent carboligase, ATP-grasp superfamily n=1 Tax=Thermomonospora echinospora TaxID=1992 RepID=A0A1H6C173_9ACTN|nr:PAC2 family protein [Thermomonospora echinospora]SEG66467.1 Predicted ATP-dependent carboligase, ATP-grasp superfamily [Thermomonospora echinospora]